MKSRWCAGASVVLGALAYLPVPVAAATSAPTPVIGVFPEFNGKTTLQSHHFAYAVPAGSSVHDAIGIINYTAKPVQVTLYAADVIQAAGGGIAPAQQGQYVNGVSKWFALKDSTLTIAPHATVHDPFVLTVPAGIVPGDHEATIVATYTTGGAGVANGYNVQAREALIANITVPGQVHSSSTLGPLKVHHTAHGVDFTITVHNTGNVLLGLGGAVRTVSGSHNFGAVLGTGHDRAAAQLFKLEPQGIYVIPGGTATLTARWEGAPLLAHERVQAVVLTDVAGQRVSGLTSPDRSVWFIAWWLIAAAAFVLLLLVLLIVTRKRRRRRRRDRRDERRAVREFKQTRRTKYVPG